MSCLGWSVVSVGQIQLGPDGGRRPPDSTLIADESVDLGFRDVAQRNSEHWFEVSNLGGCVMAVVNGNEVVDAVNAAIELEQVRTVASNVVCADASTDSNLIREVRQVSSPRRRNAVWLGAWE